MRIDSIDLIGDFLLRGNTGSNGQFLGVTGGQINWVYSSGGGFGDGPQGYQGITGPQGTGGGTTGTHVSDLYYCEYDGGSDYFPEVYYGRFSANNINELRPQIDKTIEYEKYLFPDDSFLNNVIMIAGVDPSFAPIHGNGQINEILPCF